MKILVISLAGIGDTLLSTSLIHELRTNFPDATIDALVRWPGAKDLLEGNPHLNRVHQKDLIKVGKFKAVRFLWSLRKELYDVSINTHPQPPRLYRLAARIIGAPVRVSHEYDCSGKLDRLLANRAIPQDYELHSIKNNLRLLPLLGAQPKLGTHEMQIFLTIEEQQWAERYLADHQLTNRKRLGIHVGSGSTKNLRFKRWPLTSYIELIRRLNTERSDLSILLFGGPDEVKDHARILAESYRRLVLQAETKNLRQAAALMKCCHAFLSVDTALMHLAAAVKAPGQIVIEAPTLNKTNLPYGNEYTLVENPEIKGRHLEFYSFDGKDIKGTDQELIDLMASVTVSRVFQAVDTVLPRTAVPN